MKISKVTYRMLRVHARFENNTAEVEVQLGPKDTVESAFGEAKKACYAALGLAMPAVRAPLPNCSACKRELNFAYTSDIRCPSTGGAHVISVPSEK